MKRAARLQQRKFWKQSTANWLSSFDDPIAARLYRLAYLAEYPTVRDLYDAACSGDLLKEPNIGPKSAEWVLRQLYGKPGS